MKEKSGIRNYRLLMKAIAERYGLSIAVTGVDFLIAIILFPEK